MRKRLSYAIISIFFIALILCNLPTANSKIGITYVPGILKIKAKLGKEYVVPQKIVVGSLCDDPRNFTLEFVRPGNYMEGYTCLPNFTWVKFTEDRFYLRQHGKKEVYLIINIPDKDEYYNKKWEVWVHGVVEKKPNERTMVVPDIYARVLIETPTKIPVRSSDITIPVLIALACAAMFISILLYINPKVK